VAGLLVALKRVHIKRKSGVFARQPFAQGCVAKKSGVGTPFPHQITRKTASNSSNEVSIRLQEFPQWIFLFHCRLLNSSANLRVVRTYVRSQPCFNVVQSSAKRCGNAVPTRSQPTTSLHLRLQSTKQQKVFNSFSKLQKCFRRPVRSKQRMPNSTVRNLSVTHLLMVAGYSLNC